MKAEMNNPIEIVAQGGANRFAASSPPPDRAVAPGAGKQFRMLRAAAGLGALRGEKRGQVRAKSRQPSRRDPPVLRGRQLIIVIV